jgi:hypothetical protein
MFLNLKQFFVLQFFIAAILFDSHQEDLISKVEVKSSSSIKEKGKNKQSYSRERML